MKTSNILFGIAGVCFFTSTTLASNVADTDIVTFTANSTAKAAEVNQNFTALKNAVNSKQDAVSGTCTVGSAIRAINADGTVTCEADDNSGGTITGITVNGGLSGGGTSGNVTISVDSASIQTRVSGTCPANSSISGIASNGSVTCEPDTAGLAGTTVLSVNCTALPTLTTSYQKVVDIGTFTKANASSAIDILLSTRFYVSTFATGSTGATFELRVDDAATTNGRARATLRVGDVGNEGRLGTINGVFTGLGVGVHTVSLWVFGWFAGGTNAGVDPGCFSSDHLVIKEIN